MRNFINNTLQLDGASYPVEFLRRRDASVVVDRNVRHCVLVATSVGSESAGTAFWEAKVSIITCIWNGCVLRVNAGVAYVFIQHVWESRVTFEQIACTLLLSEINHSVAQVMGFAAGLFKCLQIRTKVHS